MEHYRSLFRQSYDDAGAFPSWFGRLRESAIESFTRLGFPAPGSEEWKYTSVDPIASVPFVHANGEGKAVTGDIFAAAFVDEACARLVFVNGAYSARLSSLSELPAGVRVAGLRAALAANDPVLEMRLGRAARFREQPFVALNTALMEDGAVVLVPEGCRMAAPIYLVFVSLAQEQPLQSQPRNLVVLGAGSEAAIVECYVGIEAGNYFTNAVTELFAAEDAVVDYYRIQREAARGFHVGALEARLSDRCSLTAHAITLGGSLVRNDLRVVLDGEGAECVLNGLYLADGDRHVDNHTEIEHAKPRTRSLELYKGVLSGSARGVFNGKIIVHKDAQKTDARQTNKNLLLSDRAVANSKPQLEIYADDVKCSHGSTIGQLDRDALFYLRSRGLAPDDARSLLSYAFARDVVGRVKIPALKERLDDYLAICFDRKREPGR
ncbi:MAG: Fe-S cluster assembly protein SufD [Deltaproteobacteria bacterium]|nr:Fe-S cluster assembly protein SufD [Deltaproteobacteria bacterium]MBI2364605.1 Fe-S cluster assembly protein SufD [Deltaproteobacteria bacterium]